jgi:hypothetical protein
MSNDSGYFPKQILPSFLATAACKNEVEAARMGDRS